MNMKHIPEYQLNTGHEPELCLWLVWGELHWAEVEGKVSTYLTEITKF